VTTVLSTKRGKTGSPLRPVGAIMAVKVGKYHLFQRRLDTGSFLVLLVWRRDMISCMIQARRPNKRLQRD